MHATCCFLCNLCVLCGACFFFGCGRAASAILQHVICTLGALVLLAGPRAGRCDGVPAPPMRGGRGRSSRIGIIAREGSAAGENQGRMPYFFILSYRVLRPMPRALAALVILPSKCTSAFRMVFFSITCRGMMTVSSGVGLAFCSFFK